MSQATQKILGSVVLVPLLCANGEILNHVGACVAVSLEYVLGVYILTLEPLRIYKYSTS